MADLVTIATTAILTQFLGPSAKHLGEQALERGKHIAAKATAYLAAVGREPQPVEPKVLLPLVQAASLETDPTLADLWAALLANAADPAQQTEVQIGFADALRQLTVADAQIMSLIYAGLKLINILDPKLVTGETIVSHFGWDETKVELSLDNLVRLRLIDALTGGTYGPSPTLGKNAVVGSTVFGRQFLQAVTPPTT